MQDRFKVSLLLQGLALVLLGPACKASSLGLTVHVVPLDNEGGNMVRAHFSAIVAGPCPDTSGLCAAGEDCLVHKTLENFAGTKPSSSWCVRQWQKTVPSKYTANISLGSENIYVSLKAEPQVRVNSGRLNQPAYVALPPPLRARVNCPHHFHLSVKDLDGDKVRCRFARPEDGECIDCTKHDFIELNEDECMFRFKGEAPAGQYFIYLMAEDRIPVPKTSSFTNSPLSAVPIHLSLTVEESTSSCSAEPVVTGDTPEEHATLFVLPYEQVQFTASFQSMLESVSEVAVVGPPGLYRAKFSSVSSATSIEMAWVRSENKLARLLSICFAANTNSLQSEPRCMWLYQREMRALPAGTELTCENTEMTLVLPITSLSNINLAELQLNSPTCPVTYNDTHLTAVISLTGCGTKRVHSGSEMIYTNTLQSVRPYTMISRKPSLILPLACRIPGANVSGPHYKIGMPTERETFGEVAFTIKFHLPGEGPLSNYTSSPVFRSLQMAPLRVRRAGESLSESEDISIISTDSSTSTSSTNSGTIGSKIMSLDLILQSNCSIDRSELIVSNCLRSEWSNFNKSFPILERGCASSNSTLEILTDDGNSKAFRLDLSTVDTGKSLMYVKCTVNLCIATMPSQKCPELCSRSFSPRALVGSVFTRSYTITSEPVSLVVTTPAPTTTAVATTPAVTNPPAATTAAATTAAATPAAPTTAAATPAAPTTAAATPAAPTPAAPTTPAATTAAATTAAATTATVTNTTTSHAPEQASVMATGLILTTIGIFLQNIFVY